MRGEEILYLSHDDVVRCAVTPHEITCAVEKAFRAKALGRAATNRSLRCRPFPRRTSPARAASSWTRATPR